MILDKALAKVFGTANERELKKHWPVVADINALEPSTQALSDEQLRAALDSRARFQDQLTKAGYGRITTEVTPAPPFYYAEDYHQQYLAKNPNGYCGVGGTGVSCQAGVSA